MKFIVKYWYSKNPLLALLLPFSFLYQFAFSLHKICYELGIKKKFIAPKPVIVIGNITVGGTGKTPFTIALAKKLLEQGYKPGIISRGYKSKVATYPYWVSGECDPRIVGDEPALIASKTNCPVVIAPKRAQAISMLMERSYCDVILSDDGLQHHAIHKDIEILIIDGERKFGNGFCLPAGPLRESIRKLTKVDFIVFNDKIEDHKYTMHLCEGEIYNLLQPTKTMNNVFPIKSIIHAVAAIGHPDRFFMSLRAKGFTIEEHPFPDHHPFNEQDFVFCQPDDIVIMTEKDAVKCRHFARPNFWVLPVKAVINDNFLRDFSHKLTGIRLAKSNASTKVHVPSVL